MNGPGYLSSYRDSLRNSLFCDRIPGRAEIFSTRPDRPWGTPSHLHNGYRVIPGVTRGAYHAPIAEVEERIKYTPFFFIVIPCNRPGYTNYKTNYLHWCFFLNLLHFKTFYTY